MQIDITFPSKIIISNLNEKQAKDFIKSFISYAWMDHDIPPQFRKMGESKKLTLDMLPKDFNLDKVVEVSFKKGLFNQEKIGLVNVNINMVISRMTGTNPCYRIQLDRYYYEQDGNKIEDVINEIAASMGKDPMFSTRKLANDINVDRIKQ